jgi:hypothetical protein
MLSKYTGSFQSHDHESCKELTIHILVLRFKIDKNDLLVTNDHGCRSDLYGQDPIVLHVKCIQIISSQHKHLIMMPPYFFFVCESKLVA